MDAMNLTGQNNSSILIDRTRDVPIPLGALVCIWCGLAWFTFILGIVLILGGVPERRSTPFGSAGEIATGIGCIAFALVWGMVVVLAYQRRPWAIRAGFWLSLAGLIAAFHEMFVVPISQIAMDDEWSVLLVILLLLATNFWLQVRMQTLHPLILVVIVCLVAYLIYRTQFSQNGRDIGRAICACPFLTYFAVWFVPYFKSCRALWNDPHASNALVPPNTPTSSSS